MKDLMKKMMQKDEAPEDNGDMKSEAKLKVLKHLKDMIKGGDMPGLKKVTVAAPNEQGLKRGLETAKDFVGKMNDFDHDQGKELMEEPTYEEDMSIDEIDAEIEHLMELKRELMEKE